MSRRKKRKAGQGMSSGDGNWRRAGTEWYRKGQEGYSSTASATTSGGWGDTDVTGRSDKWGRLSRWSPKPTCAFVLKSRTDPKVSTSIWGGKADEMIYTPVKLLICLEQTAGAYRPSPRVTISEQAKKFFTDDALKTLILPTCPWVSLHWPDFGVPRLNQVWWQKFVDQLREMGGAVGLCCSGGIGRTGTALSIIAAMGGAMEDTEDPVKFVRDNYFDDAVESDEQIRYIERITGATVHEPLYGYYDYTGNYKSAIKDDNSSERVPERVYVPGGGTSTAATLAAAVVEPPSPEFNGTKSIGPEAGKGLIKSAIESAKVLFKDGALP